MTSFISFVLAEQLDQETMCRMTNSVLAIKLFCVEAVVRIDNLTVPRVILSTECLVG